MLLRPLVWLNVFPTQPMKEIWILDDVRIELGDPKLYEEIRKRKEIELPEIYGYVNKKYLTKISKLGWVKWIGQYKDQMFSWNEKIKDGATVEECF